MSRMWTEKDEMARKQRRNPTASESALWQAIRARQLGVHFRREVVRHGFILDFFCNEKQLAVEVDGGYHLSRLREDEMRDKALQRCGIKTIRFTDEEVMEGLSAVLDRLRKELGDCPPSRQRKKRCSTDNPTGMPIGILIRNLLRNGWRYKEAVARAKHLAAIRR